MSLAAVGESEGGLPPEPERLRRRLRERAGEDPGGARVEIEQTLTEHLWRHLGHELRARGARKALLREQVAAARGECWLWVMGDRPWVALAASILGRVARRICVPDRG